MWLLRKVFNDLNSAEAMEILIQKMSQSKNNEEFLQNMNK
jgi:transcription termination factor Rho